ncbi:glycosyl transferase family 1, partial [bacterium]
PSSIHAAEIKAICGQLDLALSGRMHMAIACLGQGTPVACITYQGKFEGLYRHFELDGLTIDPVTATQPGRLAAFFLPVIDRREAIRRQIQSQLPKVRVLAAENFRLAQG